MEGGEVEQKQVFQVEEGMSVDAFAQVLGVESTDVILAHTELGAVHYGFWAALQSVWDKLEAAMADALTITLPDGSQKQVAPGTAVADFVKS